MERLTETFRNGDGSGISKGSLIDRPGKGLPSATALAIVTKLADYEDLEELIGVPLKELADIFNSNVPKECKNPKKAIILTDDDVDKWHEYKTRLAVEGKRDICVSDEVCEWKLEDEEANLYVTKCQQRHLIFEGTPKDNGYKHCPYCGKKIKVVDNDK